MATTTTTMDTKIILVTSKQDIKKRVIRKQVTKITRTEIIKMEVKSKKEIIRSSIRVVHTKLPVELRNPEERKKVVEELRNPEDRKKHSGGAKKSGGQKKSSGGSTKSKRG